MLVEGIAGYCRYFWDCNTQTLHKMSCKYTIYGIRQYTSKVGAPYFSKQFLLSLAPQVTLVGSKVKLLLTRFRNLNVISQCHEVCLSAPACLGLSPSSLALQACPEAEGKSFSDGKTWDGTVFFLRIHEDQFPTSNG